MASGPARSEPLPAKAINAPGRSFSRISIGAVQPKLAVNTPGDAFEQEADAMADNVMRSESASPASESLTPGLGFSFSQVPILSAQSVSRSVQRDPNDPDGGAPAPVVADDIAGVIPATDAPSDASTPLPVAPTPAPDPNADTSIIPTLSTPVNDALGIALGIGGMMPGPLGPIATGLGGLQSATQGPTPGDPGYDADKALQIGGLGSAAAGLGLFGEGAALAAGPIGLGLAGAGAAAHFIPQLFQKMIEGGQESNPGQFGPDPMDALSNGQQGY